MNLWDTPPGGDFVTYVERLMAQAAVRQAAARQALADDGDFGFSSGPVTDGEVGSVAAPPAPRDWRARGPVATPIGPASVALSDDHPLARLLANPLNQLRQRLEQIQAQQQQRFQQRQPPNN